MILDFADEGTEDIFHGTRSKAARRCLPQELWPDQYRIVFRFDGGDARQVQIVDYH